MSEAEKLRGQVATLKALKKAEFEPVVSEGMNIYSQIIAADDSTLNKLSAFVIEVKKELASEAEQEKTDADQVAPQHQSYVDGQQPSLHACQA